MSDIIPCGGARLIGPLASLFLSRAVRPLILLDGDEAGRARGNALMKELYFGNERAVLMLPVVLHKDDCEIEDLIGETGNPPSAEPNVGVRDCIDRRGPRFGFATGANTCCGSAT